MKRFNPLRADTSRTITIRRQLLGKLRIGVKQIVSNLSLYGWKELQKHNSAYEQIVIVGVWINHQLNEHVIGRYQNLLWRRYVSESFERGISRSYGSDRKTETRTTARRNDQESIISVASEANRTWYSAQAGNGNNREIGDKLSVIFSAGGRAEFVRSVLSSEETIKMLKMLQERAIQEVGSTCRAFVNRCMRIYSDCIIKRLAVEGILSVLQELFRSLVHRMAMIVNAEIVRAQAEGQLCALEALHVSDVLLNPEWQHSGSACMKCRLMAKRKYTVGEARGLIPFHPNCYCSWKLV